MKIMDQLDSVTENDQYFILNKISYWTTRFQIKRTIIDAFIFLGQIST